jgi:hypothetical protein
MAWGGHGLPKISPRPDMPYPSIQGLQPLNRRVAHQQSRRRATVFYPIAHSTPYAYGIVPKLADNRVQTIVRRAWDGLETVESRHWVKNEATVVSSFE